jgi:hypothetical protein
MLSGMDSLFWIGVSIIALSMAGMIAAALTV